MHFNQSHRQQVSNITNNVFSVDVFVFSEILKQQFLRRPLNGSKHFTDIHNKKKEIKSLSSMDTLSLGSNLILSLL